MFPRHVASNPALNFDGKRELSFDPFDPICVQRMSAVPNGTLGKTEYWRAANEILRVTQKEAPLGLGGWD